MTEPPDRDDHMDHVVDVFVDEFRRWARNMGTRNARLHLAGYVGSTVICVYEPWPDGVPGLFVGDLIEEDWPDDRDAVADVFTFPLVEMLEPGGSRSFDLPREADHSIIHWGEPEQFGGSLSRTPEHLPRTPEQLRAGVVPPGFISRLPDPWPGPAPPFPNHPRPPVKTMLADLAKFAVVYAAFRLDLRRDD